MIPSIEPVIDPEAAVAAPVAPLTAPARHYTLADLQRVAPQVLARLRALAPLPVHGTVAGQSVASLFWEELGHPVRGPINDIDVFVNLNLPRTQRGLEAIDPQAPHDVARYQPTPRLQSTTQHFNDVNVEAQDYNHLKSIALRSTTSILRTYRVGLVNYTLIHGPLLSRGAPGHGIEVSQSLVSGFDLNLVGAGINLDTEEVVASPGFLEFLNTTKIQAATCYTPAHTMIRLAKKCYGGQITGATCDFAAERKMLELALYLQGGPRQDGQGASLNPVLRYGVKYQQDHACFAEHLPTSTPKKASYSTYSRDGSNGSYTFHTLDVGPSEDPVDQALMAPMTPDNRIHLCALRPAYVAHFPDIYSLFHPERSTLPPEELALRRAAFEQMASGQSAVHNLGCLQRALGRAAPTLEVDGMDKEDAFVFFFNQDCAQTPELVQQAVAAWRDLGPVERAVLTALDQRADLALAFSQDHDGTWKKVLLEYGASAVLPICSLPAAHEHLIAPALTRLLDRLEEMGTDASQVLEQLVPVSHRGAEGSPLEKMLRALPASQREAFADRLMRMALPQWPALATEEAPETRLGAMALWAVATGRPVPDAFWSVLPPDEVPRCLEQVCQSFLYSRSQQPARQAQLETLIATMLPSLSVAQLGAENGRLVRMLLCVDAFGLLCDSLSARAPDETGLTTATQLLKKISPALASLSTLVQGLRQSSDQFSLPLPRKVFLDNTRPHWNVIANPRTAAAHIEHLLLSQVEQVALPPARRGPRL